MIQMKDDVETNTELVTGSFFTPSILARYGVNITIRDLGGVFGRIHPVQ